MSTLMFWNKQNAANQNNETKNGKRNWLHAPDSLLNGHVVYLVKFFGNTPVEQAKGIEVVKDAIRRLQFAQQMKKAETGNNAKTKKVEITVSVDGVAIQEPRTQKILHQFPLHNISYCADEKGVKKFFSFIAKTGQSPIQNGTINNTSNNTITTNGHSEEGHECFVFISSKLASDITLTIGQAFDLAYRRFMNDSGKTTELSKVQIQNKQMEKTISVYKYRLKELSELIPKSDLERMMTRLGIRDLFEVPMENGVIENHVNNINGSKTSESDNSITSNDDKLLIETSNKHFAPIIPPRNLQNQINNTLEALKPGGQKVEELLLNSDSDSDFDPRAEENDSGNKITNDLFGFEPPKTFGQQLFANNNNNNINNNNLTNGMNGSAPPTSPPPLLAPPPKAAVPRRITNGNGNMNGSQDLFGSTPFNPNTPTIFDAKFGSDSNLNTTFNVSNNSISTMDLNSTAFEDNIKNPFNESGIFDHSDSKINVLSDIHAFSNNSEKLNGILKSDKKSSSTFVINSETIPVNAEKIPNPFTTQTTSSPIQNGNTLNEIKGKEFSIPNPFGKKAETLLGTRSNYDALRSSPDLDTMPIVSVEKEKPTVNYDFFREAASAAFSELNTVGSSKGNSKQQQTIEFSNRMAGLNLSAQSSSSFGTIDKSNFNPTKAIMVDDFSLESLDPLRK